jgi:hypothetical protein
MPNHPRSNQPAFTSLTGRQLMLPPSGENFESIVGGKHRKTRHFTPIRRADSRTQRFQEVKELKSKIEEMKVFQQVKV